TAVTVVGCQPSPWLPSTERLRRLPASPRRRACVSICGGLELEHFTIPPYLCALYSLDATRNPVASEVAASVFVEEMLHMALASNLLNAVGGRPRLDWPRMLPGYLRCLPHADCSFLIPLPGANRPLLSFSG